MITGPTVAPIGDLSPLRRAHRTISVTSEEMPAIADGLDTVSHTCADRTVPILGIATRPDSSSASPAPSWLPLRTGLAADLGVSAAGRSGATAAVVRVAHSSYLQVENTVAGWFDPWALQRTAARTDGGNGITQVIIAGEPGGAYHS